jgi:hypothetical protein
VWQSEMRTSVSSVAGSTTTWPRATYRAAPSGSTSSNRANTSITGPVERTTAVSSIGPASSMVSSTGSPLNATTSPRSSYTRSSGYC